MVGPLRIIVLALLFLLLCAAVAAATLLLPDTSSFLFLHDDDDSGGDEHYRRYLKLLRDAVETGDLTSARTAALDYLWSKTAYSSFLHSNSNEGEQSVARAYSAAVDKKFDDKEGDSKSYLDLVRHAAKARWRGDTPLIGGGNADDCWENVVPDDASRSWDECCSMLPQPPSAPPTDFGIGVIDGGMQGAGVGGDRSCRHLATDSKRCCDFGAGSINHLRLPALREPIVRVRLEVGSDVPDARNVTLITTTTKKRNDQWTLTIEQDGYLRPFDVSGILWPSGYLLSLCVASPVRCGATELLDAVSWRRRHAYGDNGSEGRERGPYAIEIGTGVGAPSVAFSLVLAEYLRIDKARNGDATENDKDNGENANKLPPSPLVVSTDRTPHALALTTANAHRNGAGDTIDTALVDHADVDALRSLVDKYFLHSITPPLQSAPPLQERGFDVVLGSSLQSLFDGTADADAPLWSVLDALLAPDNPHAVAALAHVSRPEERIRTPPYGGGRSGFVCIKRISGDVFGMTTRDGSTSDFEVSLFIRQRGNPNGGAASEKQQEGGGEERKEEL